MSAVEVFVKSPSKDQLEAFTKGHLIKVAKHYDHIFRVIKEELVKLGVLSWGSC